ncbi:LPS O-antigen chain length determinant protein WzzB [Pseudomonas guariconensis]|uniref:LPS O-antigen chain length determinant protein WzzB n=1 Tax=Pseudomonas guariconensis TaxID=1288410 RepID=UPI0018A9A909|nr:Wzz/FepE/Etk N-terminal domain-containing protein [Pseudomonas guariconensis]MBF8742368.1 LPS O-antigen chain length determinant protein WzzB [Pseudomonas guariconensis]MBF8751521.1 LPS O-antigen chain length determinant protein WzzB [Pseudomonas guariconensis]
MRNEPERLSSTGDEIDLFELIQGLWKQKVLIIVTTVVVTAIAVAYAFLAKPVYEAKVFVQPPTQNDIAQLNYGRGGTSGLNMLSVKDVYDIYLRNLQSESLRREFFRSVYLPSLNKEERNGSQDELYGKFQEVLSLGLASKDAPSRFFVKAKLSNPQLAAEWVVLYLEMAGRRSSIEVVRDVKADATVKANNLEQQINAALESARKQREDQIIQLSEALKIARSIGLERPPIISNSLANEVSAGMDGSLTYMRGSKALEAEIDNLRKRISDDPFVKNLRQRQEAQAFYRSLQIDPSIIQVYRQDGAIESPDKPVKPEKLLIVVLGALVGGGLGVALGLLRYLTTGPGVRKEKEE